MTAPWVLVRGLTREAGHWSDFASALQTGIGAGRVLALDLPGNGALYQLQSPLTVSGMVAHARNQLRAWGLAPPYRVLAMSLGAMVATEWARQAPQEVEACVLISTSMRPFSAFHQRLRPSTWAPLLRLLLTGASAMDWEATVQRLTSQLRQDDAQVLAHWLSLRAQHPVSAANALRQLLAAARYCGPLQAPVPRTLLLAGERDALVAVACSKALAARWACMLRLHPDAGHDLPLDDPDWVIAQLKGWLADGLR